MSKYTGSDFDELLRNEGILEETIVRAQKRLLALRSADATELADEPFIGMWCDRKDMQDRSAWVRRVRGSEWKRSDGDKL